MEKNRVFRSRLSVPIILFILLLFIPLIQYEDYKMLWIVLPIILIFTGTRYVISENKMFIKICFFIPCGNINIADIVLVKRSYNPLSSPAASLKRLRVSRATGGGYLISPAREREFIRALKVINPNIQVNVFDKKGVWRILDWSI